MTFIAEASFVSFKLFRVETVTNAFPLCASMETSDSEVDELLESCCNDGNTQNYKYSA